MTPQEALDRIAALCDKVDRSGSYMGIFNTGAVRAILAEVSPARGVLDRDRHIELLNELIERARTVEGNIHPGWWAARIERECLRPAAIDRDAVWAAVEDFALDIEARLRGVSVEPLEIAPTVDRIVALVRPGAGVTIAPGSDEAKAILRAREMLVREGDDFWFANTLRALAARLEAAS